MPVLGWMTTMSGTVYVARGHGGSAMRARKGMQAAVDAGLPVVFFPEGTTSNGSGLLKFHSGLLAQVMESGAPITAAHIQYSLTEEMGRMLLWRMISAGGATRRCCRISSNFLGCEGVRAEVRFAEQPIAFSANVTHRKQAAIEARAAVASLGDVREHRVLRRNES